MIDRDGIMMVLTVLVVLLILIMLILVVIDPGESSGCDPCGLLPLIFAR